jgi:hypothetical protein
MYAVKKLCNPLGDADCKYEIMEKSQHCGKLIALRRGISPVFIDEIDSYFGRGTGTMMLRSHVERQAHVLLATSK